MPRYRTDPSQGVVNEKEVLDMLKACKNVKEKAVISFLWLTGCRVSEALAITTNDIELSPWLLTIKLPTLKKKRKADQEFKITYRILKFKRNDINPNPFIESFITYYKSIKEGLIFPMSDRTIERIVNRVSKKALGRILAPHHIRHSRLTYLAEKGYPIHFLQYFKGASDIKSVAPYLHARPVELED